MPVQKSGPTGAAGKVIQYEESPGRGILYQEESGGLVRPLPPAPAARERVPRASAAPSAASKKPERETPTVAKKPAGAPVAKRPAAPEPVVAAPPAPSWGERMDRAAEAGDADAILALAALPEAKLDCEAAYRSWAIARAFEEKGDVAAATRVLDPLLTGCSDGVVRATTLEIARELVEPETLARWVERERPNERVGEAQQRYDRLAIALALARSVASKAPAAERARAVEREVGEAIVSFRDADGASGLGWLWLEARDPATAALWFGRAQAWVPGDETILRGLAYAALQERRFDDALEVAAKLTEGEERGRIVRDAHVGKGERAFHFDRFAEAIGHLERASRSAPLPRHAREMEAWSYSRTGRKADAARRFAELYREAPDKPAAEGLLAAYEDKAMIDAGLRATEPLASMLRAERAIAAFSASRFLEAAALAPERFAAAGGVGAPQASVYAAGRKRSGEEGLSKYKAHDTLAVETGAVVAEGLAVRLRLERHAIRSGRPAAGTLIGSAAQAIAPPEFEETRASVDEGRIALRFERGVAVNAHLGVASAEAGLAQRAVGGVEIEGAPTWGYFAVGIAREPVRESVLAFAGMKDPYGELAWGRVDRDAVSARSLVLMSPWTVGAAGRLARLEGVNVRSNRQRNLEVSGGYDLGLAGFAYTAASIAASMDEYDRNLGAFTLGHGGYFSPQRYRRLGAAFDFMTAENRRWIARGRVSVGTVSKQVDDAPFLPLAPDGRVYPATPSERSRDTSGNVTVVAMLSPHVQMAAGISRSISPQYAETQAFLQVRILFEARSSVVSADLPVFVR